MSEPSDETTRAPREHWYPSAGARLYAVELGSGPPLVFLHGGLADHRAALRYAPALTASCRLIAPDVRGAGRSIFRGPLDWDGWADDIAALLDHLGLERAVVGGVSAGSAIALRCALRHPGRVRGLVLIAPVYRGDALGLDPAQRMAMERMDAFARRAVAEGIEALLPLYGQLPEPMRQRALAMARGFDVASVAATTRFLAEGAAPFRALADLGVIDAPTLLVPGADPEHPADLAALYARHIPLSELCPPATEPELAIARFCAALAAQGPG